MSEWERLKARYGSNKQYEKRKVLFNQGDKEDFIQHLIDQGAEIMLEPKQSESFRFRINGELGIVYQKGSGNLLAHDMGYRYDCKNNQDDVIEAKNCKWIPKYKISELNYKW